MCIQMGSKIALQVSLSMMERLGWEFATAPLPLVTMAVRISLRKARKSHMTFVDDRIVCGVTQYQTGRLVVRACEALAALIDVICSEFNVCVVARKSFRC